MAEKKSDSNEDSGLSPAKALFQGQILNRAFFPFPEVADSEKETLRLVMDSIDKFMQPYESKYAEFDREGYQPEAYIEQLKELGLFGLIIPEDFQGLGFSSRAYSRVMEQTCFYDASTSLTIGAHSSIGMKGILLFGSEEQKRKYLPRLATGELIAAFCLTESGSGSDAASIKTQAVKNPDGSWTLSGEKIWITNGAFADLFTVFARTDSEGGKISAFIVERAFPGVESGPKEQKMGIRASATTTVRFDNVQVPAECLLGEEGKGFKVAMSILNNGRTGLGGGAVGAMKKCIKMASRQALERKQFGASIASYELVKEKIARMTALCFATESLVGLVGHYIDSGVEDYSVEAAISKIFASESLWTVANDALQIAGGNGYMQHFPYERIVRDSRINLIFEGTNEILRLFIALSSLKDAGEYLKEVGKGVSNILSEPIKGFGLLSDYASKRLTEITHFGRSRVEFAVAELAEEALFYESSILELSKVSGAFLKKYRGNILGRQFPQKRLAEAAVDIFAGLASLSRVASMAGSAEPEQLKAAVDLVKVLAALSKARIQDNLAAVERASDTAYVDLADYVLKTEGYPWDVL